MYAAGMLLLHDCLGRWNGVYLRTAAGMTAQAEGRGREVLRRIKDARGEKTLRPIRHGSASQHATAC